jgi:foldase protein PrsA
LFLAASVNGKLVTRFELDRELEKQTGKDTLENVITKQLILQEAQKQNISVPDSEVDTKLADIEKQVGDKGAKLDELLAAQGQTRDSLKEQLMLQVLIEKLVGKDITVTDDEVTGYFTKNAASYPKGTTLDSVKETIKSQLNQQKLSEKVNTWIQDLRAQAKVEYFIKF